MSPLSFLILVIYLFTPFLESLQVYIYYLNDLKFSDVIFISLLYLYFYFINFWCDFYQIPSSVYF